MSGKSAGKATVWAACASATALSPSSVDPLRFGPPDPDSQILPGSVAIARVSRGFFSLWRRFGDGGIRTVGVDCTRGTLGMRVGSFAISTLTAVSLRLFDVGDDRSTKRITCIEIHVRARSTLSPGNFRGPGDFTCLLAAGTGAALLAGCESGSLAIPVSRNPRSTSFIEAG